ncbi:hypothetical protein [Kitasatospora sp. NPDC057223]|uniref:hypothetical protein n=1 Tax=Kitasatospora sp. NPDC057223 TaxID=3346055 RepID=UPI00362A0F37
MTTTPTDPDRGQDGREPQDKPRKRCRTVLSRPARHRERTHGDGRCPGPDSGLTAVVIVKAFADVPQSATVVAQWMT